MKLVLGSSSKFRKRILQKHFPNVSIDCISPDIDERAISLDTCDDDRSLASPSQLTLAISNAKADALLDKISEPCLLITCDQVIQFDGRIREKPTSEVECRAYLHSYSLIKPAITYSAVCITDTSTLQRASGVDVCKQYFKPPIPDNIIDALIRDGDIMHCAGGFMVDDERLYPYLGHREGDEDSIVGMPMRLLKKLLDQIINNS